MKNTYGKRCDCGAEITMTITGKPGERAMADELDRQAREHTKRCRKGMKKIGKRP